VKIIEICDICGKPFDIMPEKYGANLRIKDLDHSLLPFSSWDDHKFYTEAWICKDCWKIYLELLDLKLTWLLLIYIQKIFLIFYRPIEDLRIARCEYCNEWFNKKHGNQKYCPECKDKQRKEYKRDHARESYRSKKIYSRDFPICNYCNKPIYEINSDKQFVHGNKKYHDECFMYHREEYQEKWALEWFEKNLYWLDPRRGVVKYNFYDSEGIRWHGNRRSPYEEYKYINATLCYVCREVGSFHIIKSYKRIENGKFYRIKVRKCKKCGREHISKKEIKKIDENELEIYNYKRKRKTMIFKQNLTNQ